MKRLFPIVFCLGLVACDPLEPTSPQAPEEDGVEPQALAAAKPTAPVDLSYWLHQRDGGIELELVVRSSHPDAPVHASLQDGDGLLLVQSQPVSMTPRGKGREGELRFFLSEDSYARGLLLQVDIELEDGSLSRSLLIAASDSSHLQGRTFSKALRLLPEQEVAVMDEAGEAVISLPADELGQR